jgi:hypothetical protein
MASRTRSFVTNHILVLLAAGLTVFAMVVARRHLKLGGTNA